MQNYKNSKVERIIFKKADGRPLRVLICDDSQFMRTNIKRLFLRLGVEECYEATNGEEAIEQYEQHKPDLVTMDITMPKLNGDEALKIIRKNDKNAKIIMITAVGHEAKVKECIFRGSINYIVKPFKLNSATDKLLSIMQKHFS